MTFRIKVRIPSLLNDYSKMDLKPRLLNAETNFALDRLQHSDNHIFVTGKAGTGKSTLLGLFRHLCKKRVAVLAPTGVAALNVNGQTIHSFFKLPPKFIQPEQIKKVRNRSIYKKLEILVIDEISMVRVDLLDHIDLFLRLNREIPEPFGGVRLIFFGDLLQLPPVIASRAERAYLTSRYNSVYFFSSVAFKSIETDFEFIQLETVYRQSERYFINLLDAVRKNVLDVDDMEELNSRVVDEQLTIPGEIILTTRNDIVKRTNQLRLAQIDQPTRSFLARISGKFDPRLYPTDLSLELKLGAQVMLLRNDVQKRYVNGSVGQISYLTADHIRVTVMDTEDETEIELARELWEMTHYKWNQTTRTIESDVIGTFEQYPIKLAWAVTIHKSQGKTFENVLLDMGTGAFETGQTYVALSRCTTLEGIRLKRPLRPSDILVDEVVVDFYNRWR